MDEELTDNGETGGVTSKWSRDELNGKTVCFTEVGGREQILHIGTIQAAWIGEPPGCLEVSILLHDRIDDPERADFVPDQRFMDSMVAGSGMLRSDFHTTEPVLRERGA